MDPEEQRRVLSAPRVHSVGRFFSITKMHDKPLGRLRNIHRWFTDDVIENLLMPLTRQSDQLSLRARDWLVTNYAKKFNIVLADETTRGPPLNVHADYRSMLTFWRRKNFDPFRRHQRIYFTWKPSATGGSDGGGNEVLEETTVGQLNFLHWAEVSGVIRYARQYVAEIEKDMATCMSKVKAQKKQDKLQGIKRKRRELSQAPKKQCFVYKIHSQVNLNPESSATVPTK